MKLYKTIFLFIGILLVFSNCNDFDYDKKRPNDFAFIYTNDFDTYNSKTCIFTRKYLNKDSTIKFCLKEEELQSVYNVFTNKDFMSFPKYFECSESKFGVSSYTLPANSVTIEITYNGIKKIVTNTTYCSRKKEQRKSKRFDRISAQIFEIIINNFQVKKMKDTDIMKL